MTPTPRAVTPSADLICWGLILTLIGAGIFQFGWRSSGWVIVGGLMDLAGIIILVTGVFWLATNVDLAARAALKVLTQTPAAAPWASSGPPAPGGIEQREDSSQIAESAAVPAELVELAKAAPTEGIATQLARLAALRDDGTITAEQFAVEKKQALRTWGGQ